MAVGEHAGWGSDATLGAAGKAGHGRVFAGALLIELRRSCSAIPHLLWSKS